MQIQQNDIVKKYEAIKLSCCVVVKKNSVFSGPAVVLNKVWSFIFGPS